MTTLWDRNLKKEKAPEFRRTLVILLILLLCVAYGILAHYIERASYAVHLQETRIDHFKEAARIAARLEAEVNSSFYLISGLSSYISLKGEISQEDFAEFCSDLHKMVPGLVNIAAAPDLVNRYVYPVEGNEMIIGMDYQGLPDQVDAVAKVSASRKPVLAGPVQLVQGVGEAVIGRFPVFTKDENGESKFWGIISTPLLTRVLYREADFPVGDPELEVALRGLDGEGKHGAVFKGDPHLFSKDPVIFPVLFVGGSWELALLPRGGWPTHAPDRTLIYILHGALCLLSILLVRSVYFYFEKLAQLHRAERSARLVKERFFTNVSHEIRTPLNAISGLSELIREETEDQSIQEQAEMLRQSALSLTDLITDALVLSEDVDHDGPPPCEPFDVNALLDEVLAPIKPVALDKKIELSVESVGTDQAIICSSERHIRQILWNLLLNAVKFTEKGSIRVKLSMRDQALYIDVADTGIGIEEEFQSKIFEAFTQEDDSPSRVHQGAGLGLAVVKRSIDLLEGQICFESEQGEGTTFSVRIPLEDCAEEIE